MAQCLTAAIVLAALAGVAIPTLSQTAVMDIRTQAVVQAEQIGLALKLFAGDNDGVFPKDGLPAALHAPKTSNVAFAVLFPTYLQEETIFGNAASAYQTRPPDNHIDPVFTGKPVLTLEPGENVYSYIMGLNDGMSPALPLVVDGTDGAGHYVTDPTKRGGVWSGSAAVVIRVDNSGALEKLIGPANARYIPLGSYAGELGGKPDDNLLELSRFGTGIRLLDPAIGAASAKDSPGK